MPQAKKTSSGKWNIKVYSHMENGKSIYESFTADTKAEAEKMALKFEKGKKQPKAFTVRMAIEKYLSLNQFLSPTTRSSYEKILEYAFQPLMERPITKLTDEDMQRAINEECLRLSERTHKPISPKTVKNEWGLIASALAECGYSYRIRLPKVHRKNEELPNPQLIINAIAGTPVELPCLLAMCCGLRLSEIRGLKYKDLRGNELWINRVMVDVDGESILKDYAKTEMSIRKILIPDYIKSLIPNLEQEDLIVPMTRNQIYHYYTRRMKQIGLDLSFHDLRHVFASVMLNELNIPSKITQLAGGWSSPFVMNKVYNQAFTDSQRNAFYVRDEYFAQMFHSLNHEIIRVDIGNTHGLVGSSPMSSAKNDKHHK